MTPDAPIDQFLTLWRHIKSSQCSWRSQSFMKSSKSASPQCAGPRDGVNLHASRSIVPHLTVSCFDQYAGDDREFASLSMQYQITSFANNALYITRPAEYLSIHTHLTRDRRLSNLPLVLYWPYHRPGLKFRGTLTTPQQLCSFYSWRESNLFVLAKALVHIPACRIVYIQCATKLRHETSAVDNWRTDAGFCHVW